MIVFITGATSGIGKYLVTRFLQDGHTVYGVGRKQSKIKALQAELTNAGYEGRFALKPCDVRLKEQVFESVSDCMDVFGGVDCAIANAGISVASNAGLSGASTSSVFEKVLQTNVFGAVYLFEAVLPHMKSNRKGQLVGIGSLASYRGLPGAGAYCSSKTALVALMESMRIDLRPFGIDVTIVNPGYIQTPLTDRNRFNMPFLMTIEKGGDRIYQAIVKKKKITAFPFPLALLVRLARLIPAGLYDFLVYRFENKKAPDGE